MPNPIDDNELEPVRDGPMRDDLVRDDLVCWDPVYLHARREAVEILLAWAVSLGWSVGYCSLYGYSNEAPFVSVMGIPSWVFWGVVVPWVVASVFTCYYSLVRMKNDSLDREPPASDPDARDTDARDTDAGDPDAGDTDASDTDASETDASETDASDPKASARGARQRKEA